MYKDPYTIASVQRAFQIMEVLSFQNGALSVSQLAEYIDVSQSTATRILQTLADCGWVEKSSKTNRYFLSNYSYQFTNRLVQSNAFIQKHVALAHLIAHKYHMIIDFDSLLGKNTVLLYRIAHSYERKYEFMSGQGIPAYCSSAGKAILSQLPENELSVYFKNLDMIRYQRRTITTEAALREELKKIRKAGYATSHEEYMEGLVSLSFPARDRYAQNYAFTVLTSISNRQLLFSENTIHYIRGKLQEII